MRIVYFGTPDFAVESLDAIMQSRHEVAAVVTVPDRQAGRGQKVVFSPVKQYALDHNLHLLQPERLRDPQFLEQLASYRADMFVVVAFRMLPEAVWNMPEHGTFNLHASLLPRYRGAAPINHAIINGDSVTGVTTFLLNHQIDEGQILLQAETPIRPDDNAGTLHDRLAAMGRDLVVETLDGIAPSPPIRRKAHPRRRPKSSRTTASSASTNPHRKSSTSSAASRPTPPPSSPSSTPRARKCSSKSSTPWPFPILQGCKKHSFVTKKRC